MRAGLWTTRMHISRVRYGRFSSTLLSTYAVKKNSTLAPFVDAEGCRSGVGLVSGLIQDWIAYDELRFGSHVAREDPWVRA